MSDGRVPWVWVQRKASEWQVYQRKRYLTLFVEDALDRVRGRADPELPAKHLRDFVGGGDFRAVGEEFAGYAVKLAGLEPDDRVLEIGSGIGRIALPLTRVIDSGGSYDGLEIVPRGVRWCQQHITPSHPNFRFHHADIANRTYNRHGRIPAEQYSFPFASGTFDLALLTSVFTHLLPAMTAHYLTEIQRVLAPGGRMLATFYLLNEDSIRLMNAGRSVPNFQYAVGEARVADADVPENAVALPETFARGLLADAGLSPAHVYYGSWCQREQSLSHQDLIVATKA